MDARFAACFKNARIRHAIRLAEPVPTRRTGWRRSNRSSNRLWDVSSSELWAVKRLGTNENFYGAVFEYLSVNLKAVSAHPAGTYLFPLEISSRTTTFLFKKTRLQTLLSFIWSWSKDNATRFFRKSSARFFIIYLLKKLDLHFYPCF